jgi:hypothetical protein
MALVPKDAPLQQALGIANSFFSPNLTPGQANGTELAIYTTNEPGLISGLGSITGGTPGSLLSTNICHYPIPISTANWLVKRLTENGVNANFITDASRRYVFAVPSSWAAYPVANRLGFDAAGYPAPGLMNKFDIPQWAYCLDAGYVSNYPNFIAKFTAFVNSHPSPPNLANYQFGVTGSMVTLAARNGTTVSSTSTGTTVTTPATSSKAYTVSVNYNKFTSEAATNGYTSVYTTTGTKSVSITVFKFANGSSLTPSQAIAQLAALGYRPATLSELYGLKTAQPSVGSSVVGLGTNLSSSYGYPTSSGSGASGLGRSSGPFSTTLYSFAAVHN